jgi:hypothetical protein
MENRTARIPVKFPTTNNHHLTPRSRQGENGKNNLLRLRADRHFYWHQLFRKPNGKERTLEEVIALLLRVHRAKGRCTKKLTSFCALEVRYGNRGKGRNVHPLMVSQPRGGMSRVH